MSYFLILSEYSMVAPVFLAPDAARVVLPTPGNTQKRIITGITNAMTSVNSFEKSIPPSLELTSENELVLHPTYSYPQEICS